MIDWQSLQDWQEDVWGCRLTYLHGKHGSSKYMDGWTGKVFFLFYWQQRGRVMLIANNLSTRIGIWNTPPKTHTPHQQPHPPKHLRWQHPGGTVWQRIWSQTSTLLKSTGNTVVGSHQKRLNVPATAAITPSATFALANQNFDVITILTPFCVPPKKVLNTWIAILVVGTLILSLPLIDKLPAHIHIPKRHVLPTVH